MLCKLSWQEETNRGLDLSRRQSGSVSISAETESLVRQAVECIVNEGVHDIHRTTRNTHVRVDLLENLVDVRGEGFDTSLTTLLVVSRLLRRRLRGRLGWGLRHCLNVSLTLLQS